jgi:hypothetical protein
VPSRHHDWVRHELLRKQHMRRACGRSAMLKITNVPVGLHYAVDLLTSQPDAHVGRLAQSMGGIKAI